MKKTLIIAFLAAATGLVAQTQNPTYVAYIEQYKQTAIEQEIQHKIPATITLAQGLLESGAGQSKLAVEANNHFGIKCHKDWTGATYTHDDETKNECFRKYDNAAQSYDDHAKFLMRPRYQALFALELTDYKGWARGLKDCGYATDPGYAPKLIKLIEDYNLAAIIETAKYSAAAKAAQAAQDSINALKTKEEIAAELDAKKAAQKASADQKKEKRQKARRQKAGIIDEAFREEQVQDSLQIDETVSKAFREKKINPAQVGSVDLYMGHTVHRQGIKKYVIAELGDTYQGIAAEFNIELRRLERYNNINASNRPKKGERIYLTGKK